jgi:hypothetical protein
MGIPFRCVSPVYTLIANRLSDDRGMRVSSRMHTLKGQREVLTKQEEQTQARYKMKSLALIMA